MITIVTLLLLILVLLNPKNARPGLAADWPEHIVMRVPGSRATDVVDVGPDLQGFGRFRASREVGFRVSGFQGLGSVRVLALQVFQGVGLSFWI